MSDQRNYGFKGLQEGGDSDSPSWFVRIVCLLAILIIMTIIFIIFCGLLYIILRSGGIVG